MVKPRRRAHGVLGPLVRKVNERYDGTFRLTDRFFGFDFDEAVGSYWDTNEGKPGMRLFLGIDRIQRRTQLELCSSVLAPRQTGRGKGGRVNLLRAYGVGQHFNVLDVQTSGGERRNHSFEGPDNRGRVALDNDIVGETRRDQFLEHETSVFRAFFQDAKSRRERDIEQQRAQACALKRAPSDIDLFLIAVLSFVEGAVEVHLQALLALITVVQVR